MDENTPSIQKGKEWMSYNKYKIKFMQNNKKLEGDIIGLEKYKHVSDPIIHKSDLDKALVDVVHKSDLDKALVDVVHKSDLDRALVDVVRKNDLDRILKDELKDVVRQSDLDKAFKEQLKDVVRKSDLKPIYEFIQEFRDYIKKHH